MGNFEEGLRHFWLRDLHNIGGVTSQGFAQWIAARDFVFMNVSGRDEFTIQMLDVEGGIRSIAHDSSRMASASFETMIGIEAVDVLPKSAAWILIRAYYAAFYAAHGLLRMFGTACVQLDAVPIAALDRVANALGVLPANGFESGFYTARVTSKPSEVHFKKSAAARKGSHEILWEVFANQVRTASNHLLSVSSGFNAVALQLSELDDLLRQEGQNAGSWLSFIRNQANYRHEFGLWFPYAHSVVSGKNLAQIVLKWRSDPSRLFPSPKSDRVTLHVWLCTVIVAICHAVALDMEAHGPRRRCFHSLGDLALTRIAVAPPARRTN